MGTTQIVSANGVAEANKGQTEAVRELLERRRSGWMRGIGMWAFIFPNIWLAEV